ncbi:MAG: hypothetical protein H6739_05985 [Alphaproteobacteria bacterium]|nr:hypothetical protein [Alphaproteobacteria bacterium]
MSDHDIAYERLGIPPEQRDKITPDAPVKTRLAVAKGLLPIAPDVLMGMVFALMSDPEKRVARAARSTLRTMPTDTILSVINARSHPKLLAFFARYRSDDDLLMERVYRQASTPDEVACQIAGGAKGDLLEVILRNQERMLMTPEVYLALRDNAAVAASDLQRVETFLKLNKCLPEIPTEPAEGEGNEAAPEDAAPDAERAQAPRPRAPAVAPPPPPPPELDEEALLTLAVQAEVAAALAGLPSPATNPEVVQQLQLTGAQRAAVDEFSGAGFGLDEAEWGFSLDLISEEEMAPDKKKNLTELIAEMSPGHKIKLAYLGNGEARRILLRDSNRVVAEAVVKSGRMTDNEIMAAASNRNLDQGIFRAIARDREMMRKYPVIAALANNPKVPVSISMGLVRKLTQKDMEVLARNKNVSSVVSGLALKMFKQKAGR